jgi:hypothetical protein
MSLTLSGDSPKISADSTGVITSGTAVTASGTSVDFTSIPSWVKRITVMFSGVSTNGSSSYLLQLGAGSIQNTGYIGAATRTGASNATALVNSTAGIPLATFDASNVVSGICQFNNITGNVWIASLTAAATNNNSYASGGSVTLSGVLDRLRITTINGTDTFDAGSINILYE